MPEQEIDLYDVVSRAVAQAVAIRAVNKLLPAEGQGGKVMPPTFSDRQYAWEDREQAVITLDTVPSHANRQEVLLGEAAEGLKLPVLRLRFRDPDQDITAYQASHRVYDALFRDAQLSGRPFRAPLRAPAPRDTTPGNADQAEVVSTTQEAAPKGAKAAKPKGRQAATRGNALEAVESSAEGADLERAGLDYATPLYQLAPHCLIYGCWDSTGSAGGLGAKFARAV
jgi:CRISPR-associated protein Csb1